MTTLFRQDLAFDSAIHCLQVCEHFFFCIMKIVFVSCFGCRVIANGIHGIEERLHVMWNTLINTGLITSSQFLRLSISEAG